MAKNGYKMVDSELHVMEPVDLWDKYIADEFKDRAPRRMQEGFWDIRTLVEGEMMVTMPETGLFQKLQRLVPREEMAKRIRFLVNAIRMI